MNKPIRFLSVGCMLLFLALLGQATYVQYWQSEELSSLSAHPDNVRVRDAEFSRERGPILVRQGNKSIAVATSKPTDSRYQFQRTYPQPFLYAHLTGFFSRDYGLGGVEASQNSLLSGSDSKLFLNRVVDLVDNQDPQGGSVELTVDPDAQRAAFDGLRNLGGENIRGSVVAIEPDTGRILAMVSSPTYNPNRLATHDFGTVGNAKSKLVNAKPSPMQNTAIEEVLPPGSTFKLVTAAAALADGYNPDTLVPGGASLDLPQTTRDLPNSGGGSCGGDKITLTRALMVSCNVAFGDIGLDLGADKLREQAQKFGFGERYFTDLDDSLTRQARSRFPEDPDKPQTAYSAIGQFEVAATPLQMAMVVAGIANRGTVMTPYLVEQANSPDLDVLWKQDPKPLANQPAMSPGNAADLADMMVETVESGTGTAAQISGVRVGGKTGTAQSAPDRPPYAWFVSFAPERDARVAVAVLIQDAGVERNSISGNGLAAPIAKAVMEAVINK